jgi:hypothetical protein
LPFNKSILGHRLTAMSSSESSPTELEFPQSPSAKEIRSDHAAALAWLKTTIATLYTAARTSPSQDKPPTLTRNAYLGLYSTVHEYTEATKTARASPNTNDLYQFLWDQIKLHCSEVRARLLSAETSTEVDARHMVERYLAESHQFTLLAGLVSNLLRSLDRTWIKRLIDDCLVWKNEILQAGVDSAEAEKIASAVATLRDQTEENDRALVDNVTKSLEAIGVRPVVKTDGGSRT